MPDRDILAEGRPPTKRTFFVVIPGAVPASWHGNPKSILAFKQEQRAFRVRSA